MKFNPGDLDKKIEIIKIKECKNELNQIVQKQEVIKKVHAKVKDTKGNKYYDAKKIVPEVTHFIYIRWSKTPVEQDMYIKYKDKMFEVISCLDMYDDKTLYEIQCTEKIKKAVRNDEGNEL